MQKIFGENSEKNVLQNDKGFKEISEVKFFLSLFII
jgi:hypothetical protein